MSKEDFLYALENAGLIDCIRDDDNKIDVDATIKDDNFNSGCWSHSGEWISCKVIYDIIEEQGGFND